jgi:hypothetical protein
MNAMLVKSLVALIPAGMLLVGSAVLFLGDRSFFALLQLLGSAGMTAVVFAHICEALHFMPWLRWGTTDSAGHYLDLVSAVLAITFFPIGYLLSVLAKRRQLTTEP